MSFGPTFLRDQRGATAAEFALVLPVALLFLLGIIDVGRYAWSMNRLEKAVQVGARYAVATAVVPGGLNKSFVDFDCGSDGGVLVAGDSICKDALGTVTCTGNTTTCTCTATSRSGSCSGLPGTVSSSAFQRIVARMRVVSRAVSTANVRVTYSGSGLGYAGDPSTDDDGNQLPEVSPQVTVSVTGVPFRSMSLLGINLRLPSFSYSQTLEDGVGVVAY